MAADLTGVRLKVERAERHIFELCDAITAAALQTRLKVEIVDNPDSGYREWTVRERGGEPPSASIGVVAGDVVHNLRAALDHLMWQLVLANDGEPSEATMFPIARTEPGYRKMRAGDRTEGVSAEVLDRLDALEPYPGGNEDLVELHRLDIVDKHKLLITAVSAAATFRPSLSGVFERWRAEAAERGTKPPPEDLAEVELPFVINYAEPVPIEVGAVLFRARLGDTSADDTRLQIHVVLDRDGVLSHEPLAAMVIRLAGAVRRTVSAFEDLFGVEAGTPESFAPDASYGLNVFLRPPAGGA